MFHLWDAPAHADGLSDATTGSTYMDMSHHPTVDDWLPGHDMHGYPVPDPLGLPLDGHSTGFMAAPHTHEPRFGGYYNADGTYHYSSDNTDRDPATQAIVRRN